ncbi:SRPBCC family protein [Halochromatium sp.]
MRAQANIGIRRPPTEVYRFIAEDFERNYPRWSPEVRELQIISPRPIRVGTQARQVRVDQGRRTESTFRITQMEPPKRLTFEGGSPAFVVNYRIEPDGDHARLVFTFELKRLEMMMRPFEKLIRLAVEDGAQRTVRNLKRLIETETEPAAA